MFVMLSLTYTHNKVLNVNKCFLGSYLESKILMTGDGTGKQKIDIFQCHILSRH